MNIDKTQKAWISKLVYENVKYNETYHEVLDHVISSLELEEDTKITFHQKLKQIWDKDFGGYENLPYLEKQREKAVNKQIGKRHLKIFKSYFRFPLIAGTILMVVFFSILSNYIQPKFFVLVYAFFGIIPVLIYAKDYFKLKKYQIGNKISIKKSKMNSLGVVLGASLNWLIFLPTFFDIEPSQVLVKLPVSIIILLAVFYVIYALSYFKLYKETFKMELSK
jgi:hypothetical protein